MNQQAILQEIGYCQLVVQAYEAYLKRTIFLDDSKGELAIQASMGASLVRTQNHAIVVQNSMDKYARNKKSLSNPAEFFASLTIYVEFKIDGKADYPTARSLVKNF